MADLDDHVVRTSPHRRRQLGRALAAAVVVFSACDLPRDPEGTLDRVRDGVMRVGVIAHEPCGAVTGVEPMGVEPALIKQFAAGLHARIRWVLGTESDL